jgi:hypothetical protein
VPVASILAALLIFSQPEALDLFVDIPPDPVLRIAHWSLFYLAAILFWVLPANFSARVALQINHERIGVDTVRRYLLFIIGLPRLLSVLCLIVIFFAFWQAWHHVPSVDRGSLGIASDARDHLQWASYWALGLCVVVMLAYLGLARLPVLRERRLRPVSPLLYDGLDGVVAWCKPKRRRTSGPLFDEQRDAAQHNTLVGVLLLLTIIFLIDVLLAILFLSPTIAALIPALESYLPRAVFVPVLLGINVPGLALLGILSHRYRLPLILGFFLLLATWGLFWENRHNVRIEASSNPVQRTSLAQAINRWKAANGCDRPDGKCAQPIIVAGSGGASRAAFMTGNALAYLQERFPNFSKQLFAISTISGSSLGAAAFVAGLDRQEAALPRDACKDRRFQGWFACHKSAEKAREALDSRTLQKRLQLFLTNDFLTPVFVTLTFSDMWRIGPNRAVKLEKSWEAAWREVTGDAARGEGEGDFGRRLSDFLPKGPDQWRPLLIFNGTSVGSGRRIVVSSLEPTHDGRRLFTDAYDFYETACPGKDGKPPGCDLRLSTAVTMSARFPLVSPSGGITRGDEIVDRIVDGGYFENFGAQTALELARELKNTPDKLEPFILQITNDPSAFDFERCKRSIPWAEQYQRRQPEMPPSLEERNLMRWALDPVNTVLATRDARGTHATAEALATVTANNYAQIHVCPQRLDPTESQGALDWVKHKLGGLLQQYGLARKKAEEARQANAFKALSASWWLSTPVQQYLHQQLEAAHNCAEIEHVHAALGGTYPARICPETSKPSQ